MIKAVLFDFGGVMKDAHPLAMDISKMVGLTEEEFESLKEARSKISVLGEKGLISDQEYWQELSKIIGKPVPDNAVEMATNFYRETFVFHQEMFDLVGKLKGQGIKTGVLSNIYKFEADVIREKGGYDGFEPVILSYEVGLAKPELDIYRLAVEKTGAKPEECIFVDDKEKNLEPAKELGIRTVLFKNPEQAIKEIFSIINAG